MLAQDLHVNAVLSTDVLRSMAESDGPCVSIYLPVTRTAVDKTRLKGLIQQADALLTEKNVETAEKERLMGKIRNFPWETAQANMKTIAFFCSREITLSFPVAWMVDELVAVNSYFQIVPILPLAQRPNHFHILALSQKHVRLLRCTDQSSVEVELPASFPRAIDADIDQPDVPVDKYSPSGASTGAMKSVLSGGGVPDLREEERLLHFYQAIDKSLQGVLKNDAAPLVVAGVDYELALYHRVNKYPHLVSGGVQGAADGLKGGELYRRALEIIDHIGDESLDPALKLYEKQGGTDKVSTDPANILKAAREGRVAHLFLASEAAPSESRNVAAIQTILHSGLVHLAPLEKMPGASTAAALFRY